MPPKVDRNNLRCRAFHEAGHAVAALKTGIAFEKVYVLRDAAGQIRRAGDSLGQVFRNLNMPDLVGKGEDEARRQVLMAFAGPYGETLAYPGLLPIVPQDDGDIQNAMRVLLFIFCKYTINEKGDAIFSTEERQLHKATMERLLNEGNLNAARFCVENAAAIIKVADALLADTELSYDRVAELCQPIPYT